MAFMETETEAIPRIDSNMQCPSCGKWTKQTYDYCDKCGYKLH